MRQVQPHRDAALKFCDPPCGLPNLRETIIGILTEELLGHRRRMRIVVAVEIVRLQDMILSVENIAAITDHSSPEIVHIWLTAQIKS
jgi:hypothetical protein